MSLLSIPSELLLDIIGHVADSAPMAAGPFNELKHLAHTCIVLRSLSITLIYASITIHREAGHLGSFLIDYPHIATCVRRLKVEAPGIWAGDDQRLLRRILERCTKLRELVLEKLPGTGGLRTGFEDEMLEYIPVESRRSMKMIAFNGLPLDGLLVHFKRMLGGEFSTLQTLRMRSCDVCNPYDVRRHREEQTQLMNALLLYASAKPPGALKSVQSFLFDAPFPYWLAEESDVGACLADAMPNLKFLSMVTSPDVIYGVLSTYSSLGSQLTELTLTGSYPSSCSARTNPKSDTPPRPHFCDIITKLSQNLTKFVIHGNSELRICHKLFVPSPGRRAENWPNLNLLSIRCLLGCVGIKPSVLRDGLNRLAGNRPGAVLFMEGRFREKLIMWNTRSPEGVSLPGAYGVALEDDIIASPEAFQRLNPPLQSLLPSNNGGVVGSNPANWSFWGPPTGNYEGTKAPW